MKMISTRPSGLDDRFERGVKRVRRVQGVGFIREMMHYRER